MVWSGGVCSEVQSVLHIALYRSVHSAVHSIVQSYTLLYCVILCFTLFYSVLLCFTLYYSVLNLLKPFSGIPHLPGLGDVPGARCRHLAPEFSDARCSVSGDVKGGQVASMMARWYNSRTGVEWCASLDVVP